MKISWVIFVCPLVIISSIMTMELTHTTFDSCNPNEWTVTNIILQRKNDTKIITCDIIYKKMDNHTIYRVHITIDECKNHTVCTGEPKVSVDNINCDSEDLSESDMNICRFANELANRGKQEEWLQYRYGLVGKDIIDKLLFCWHFENTDISASDESDEFE